MILKPHDFMLQFYSKVIQKYFFPLRAFQKNYCIPLNHFLGFFPGDIIVFDVFTIRTEASQVKLTHISKTCINPLNKS